MTHRIEVGYRPGIPDPRGLAVLDTIRSFLSITAHDVRAYDVYTVDVDLSPEEADKARDHFTDPVTQHGAIDRLKPPPFDFVVSVGFRPGVTDAVGKSALALLRDMLGRPMKEEDAVYTSRLYFLSGVDEGQAKRIASDLLANALIERFEVQSHASYLASEPDRSVPVIRSTHEPAAPTVDLSGSDDDLMRISKERILSLSLEEMRTIRDAFTDEAFIQARAKVGLGGTPTDAELECLAQTWSEHCKHKIFNATIDYHEEGKQPETIESLFKTYIRNPTERIRAQQEAERGSSWLISVFHDNAGVIAFNRDVHLVYKVETHNSPSALDPYGGAMTGIVGVNRDPFGTGLGAELLFNVWGYCFADPRWQGVVPKGLMHPRRIRDGVHRGVIEGGNQSGIPYGRGWEFFDDRYLGKPLVYCGTVGKMPVTSAGRPTHEKAARPGDRLVMCGGRIGKDGIHGATFSSAELDESSPVQAVQIGDPITQKRMWDFLIEARDRALYTAITDNGAGGLSSSVGELCTTSGGANMDLAKAPLKYAGLDPWEILISEAQERMTVAVAPEHLEAFLELARRREVEASDLGEFTDTGYLHIRYGKENVAYLPLDFLHDGLPPMRLTATWTPPKHDEPSLPKVDDWTDTLLSLLGRPNLTSGEKKARHYDHEVKGLSVIKPFMGIHCDVPSDAAVFLVQHGSLEGVVLSEGLHPSYADIDTRWATAAAIDEAVRKAVGTGARLDHMAGLDNYCWPDPVRSDKTPDGEYKLAQLVRSTRALAEFCEAYGVPCISGKDSMKNDSMMGGVKISIPPTLLFSVIAKVDDVTKAVSIDVKQVGSRVYLLGVTRDELGGSELFRLLGDAPIRGGTKPRAALGNAVPRVYLEETLPLYRAVQTAIERELLLSCHAVTRGGLAVALARTALGGRLGLDLDLDHDEHLQALSGSSALFSESTGRLVVTLDAARCSEFEALLPEGSFAAIGEVTQEPSLRVRHRGRSVVETSLDVVERVWKETFDAL
jgi:phosphoribosylformylglycinamidine synthase subunit PurSL